MAGLRFKVHYNGVDAVKRKLARNNGYVEHVLAVQVAKDTSPFVPMLTGALDDRTQVRRNLVIYPGPSARYLYGGLAMVDARTGKGPMRIVDKNGNEYIRFRKGAKLKPSNKKLNYSKAAHPQAQDHWLEPSKKKNLNTWKKVAAEAIKRGIK